MVNTEAYHVQTSYARTSLVDSRLFEARTFEILCLPHVMCFYVCVFLLGFIKNTLICVLKIMSYGLNNMRAS